MQQWKVFLTIGIMIALVITTKVNAQDQDIAYAGVTEAYREVTIAAPVNGLIERIDVTEGDWVDTNDSLITLERSNEVLQKAVRQLLWQDKSALHAAETRVNVLKSLLASSEALFKSNASLSQRELEKERLEYALALAELQQNQTTEAQQELEYELSLAEFNRRSLLSPLPAMVTRVYFDKGERCQLNEPLLDLVDLSRVIFVVNLEESVANTFSLGQKASLNIKSGQVMKTIVGQITYIAPIIDQASGLVELKVAFDNIGKNIRPGTSGFLLSGGD
jgi:RND family efflux transporter MFP subunit